jgi:hypothetical protein
MIGEAWLAWALIVGAALVAFLTRAIFILPGSHLRLPSACCATRLPPRSWRSSFPILR